MDPVRSADVDPGTSWHRMHPVTPLLKGWAAILVVFGIAAQMIGLNPWDLGQSPIDEFLADGQDALSAARSAWLPIVAFILIYAAGVAAVSYLSWTRTRYCITNDAVHLASGVISRSRRQARLDRLQAVDITQPLLARIFGLAKLTLVMAGGGESKLELAYLTESRANEVRADLLARSAGLKLAAAAPQMPDVPAAPGASVPQAVVAAHAPVAPEATILEVPSSRLIRALIRLLVIPAIVVAVILIAASVALAWSGEIRALGAVLGPLLPVALVVVAFAWNFFSRNFAFRIAASPDGLRLYHGLVEKKSQTVPPGRVQALGLTQPLLWRALGWWRVQLNVAGLAGSEDAESTHTTLLPVGTIDEVERILELVLPGAAAPEEAAMRRAVLLGKGAADGLTIAPRRARWLDPLAWRRNAFANATRALWLRSGRITRRAAIVPHERTQSLRIVQGPLQRRLGLATFHADTVAGPVRAFVEHLTASDAAALLDAQAAQARRARVAAGPELWMRRMVGPVSPVDAEHDGAAEDR